MSLLLHLSNQTESSPSNNKALIDEKDCEVNIFVFVVVVAAVVVVDDVVVAVQMWTLINQFRTYARAHSGPISACFAPI